MSSASGRQHIHSRVSTLLQRGIMRAEWLCRDRIIAWATILLALEAAFFIFLVLWNHGIFVPIDPPTTTDFVSFYAAGKLTLAGTPWLVYDHAVHYAAEVAATAPGIGYLFFFYPPVYLLLCAPLALLPYIAAFVVFQAVQLAGFLLVMRRILQIDDWLWWVPVVAFPSVFWTMGIGQNAMLTAALFGGSMVLLDAKPVLSGVLAGLICYKPHFGLLLPIVFAAGGHWRAFAAAAVTVVALVGVSVGLFGLETWRAFLSALAGSHSVYETGQVDLNAFVTPYGAVRVLGGDAGAARTVQAIISVLVAGTVCLIWRRDPGAATRSAALAAGMLLVVPLALMYDLLLVMVAIGWLVRTGRSGGFIAGEKLALFVCFLIPLFCRHLAQLTHIPLGPVAPMIILGLCSVRTRGRRTGQVNDRAPVISTSY